MHIPSIQRLTSTRQYAEWRILSWYLLDLGEGECGRETVSFARMLVKSLLHHHKLHHTPSGRDAYEDVRENTKCNVIVHTAYPHTNTSTIRKIIATVPSALSNALISWAANVRDYFSTQSYNIVQSEHDLRLATFVVWCACPTLPKTGTWWRAAGTS